MMLHKDMQATTQQMAQKNKACWADLIMDSLQHQRFNSIQVFIPALPHIANISMKYFILSKVYTDEGGIK